LLIGIKKKLLIKRRINIFKKVLLERAISLKKEELKKKIEIYKCTKNKYIIFPAKGSFYQKEVLKFKDDIELMLENSFDLLVWLKDSSKGYAQRQPSDVKGLSTPTALVHAVGAAKATKVAKVAKARRER
jgi:hypothetical protein